LAPTFIAAPIFQVSTIRIAATFLFTAFILYKQQVVRRQKPPMRTDFVHFSKSNFYTEALPRSYSLLLRHSLSAMRALRALAPGRQKIKTRSLLSGSSFDSIRADENVAISTLRGGCVREFAMRATANSEQGKCLVFTFVGP
jgi:hypothetical protein